MGKSIILKNEAYTYFLATDLVNVSDGSGTIADYDDDSPLANWMGKLD